MSSAKKGIAKTEEHKTLISKAKKGKPLTEAHKELVMPIKVKITLYLEDLIFQGQKEK